MFAGLDPLMGEMLPVVWSRLLRSHVAKLLVASWVTDITEIHELSLCAVCTKGLHKWMSGRNWRSVVLCLWPTVMWLLWIYLLWWIMHFPPCPASVWKCVVAFIALYSHALPTFLDTSFSVLAGTDCYAKHNISLAAMDHTELTGRRWFMLLVGNKSLLHGAVGSKWWRSGTCLILKINRYRK